MAIDLVATLRLNDRMTTGLNRASRQLNSFSNTTRALGTNRGFSTLSSKVVGLTASIGGAITAAKALNATIGEAMRYEQSEVLVTAMFDDKKASKQYTKMVQKMAEESPIMDSSTMMNSSKAFIGITKDLPALEKAWSVAEKLSIMDPEQGLEGAVYAMKELASGDGVSMAERFEMPKSVVNDIKKLNFDEQLVAMEQYLNKTGITNKTVESMGNTTLSKWNQIKEKLQSTFRTMGMSGNSAIGSAFDSILKGLDSGAFDGFAKTVDNTLGSAMRSLATLVQTVDWQSVATKATAAFTSVTTVIKSVSSFIVEHFDAIKNAVVLASYAFIAFKAVGVIVRVVKTIISVFRVLKSAIGFVKIAFTILKLAMKATPFGWVITLVTSLIAFAIKLAKTWDSTKSVWENVWYTMKKTAEDTVNSVINGINKMITLINKLPGVNIPVVAKVDWTNDIPNLSTAGSVSNKTGASASTGTGHLLGNHAGISDVRGNTPRMLHDGERVLTKVENSVYKKALLGDSAALATIGGNGAVATNATTQNATAPSVTFNMNGITIREEADIKKITDQMTAKLTDLLLY